MADVGMQTITTKSNRKFPFELLPALICVGVNLGWGLAPVKDHHINKIIPLKSLLSKTNTLSVIPLNFKRFLAKQRVLVHKTQNTLIASWTKNSEMLSETNCKSNLRYQEIRS